MNTKAMEILEKVYNFCKEKFGDILCDAYLYGSYARGDYDKWSDVDIFVTVKSDYPEIEKLDRFIAKIGGDLSLEYEVTVSIVTTPVNQFNRYSEILPYYKNILFEGIKYVAA